MLIDMTLKLTPQMLADAQGDERKSLIGHIGTHFDAMEAEFPLEYTRRQGLVFDVSAVKERDIDSTDIDLAEVRAGMFVAFYTGFLDAVGYGNKTYFKEHPQLSDALIDRLLERGVSIIGVDFAGIRRGAEHIPKDRYCAERGTFMIENLCALKEIADRGGRFTAHTYPMNCTGITGLPCRVVAEIE